MAVRLRELVVAEKEKGTLGLSKNDYFILIVLSIIHSHKLQIINYNKIHDRIIVRTIKNNPINATPQPPSSPS